MTSAVGPKKKKAPEAAPRKAGDVWLTARRPAAWGRRVSARPRAGGPAAVCAGRRRRGGFTLLESLLVLALLGLLACLVVGSFHGTMKSTRIKENATRIASLLRTLRAEAANAGKRFRLSFDEETGQPAVDVEPDPLGEPGAFQPCRLWWVDLAKLKGGVFAAKCELTGASAFSDLEASQPGAADEDPDGLATVMFYPDGTSDSARILLANSDEDNPWAVEITLNGVDGTIETREIDIEEEPIEQR